MKSILLIALASLLMTACTYAQVSVCVQWGLNSSGTLASTSRLFYTGTASTAPNITQGMTLSPNLAISETYCLDANGNVLSIPYGKLSKAGPTGMTDGILTIKSTNYYCGKVGADDILTYTTLMDN